MPYSLGTLVQGSDGTGTPITSLDASSSFTPTAGSAIVVWVWTYSFSEPQTVTVSDATGGNDSFTEVGSFTSHNGIYGLRQFVLLNAAATSTTLRASFSGNSQYTMIAGIEVLGIAATSAVVGNAAQSQADPGTGTDAISTGNTGTLSGQPAAVLGFHVNGQHFTPTPVVGTGYTNAGVVSLGASPGGRVQHKRVTATTAVASTATSSAGASSVFNSTVVVLLEGGGGGGGFTVNPLSGRLRAALQ